MKFILLTLPNMGKEQVPRLPHAKKWMNAGMG